MKKNKEAWKDDLNVIAHNGEQVIFRKNGGIKDLIKGDVLTSVNVIESLIANEKEKSFNQGKAYENIEWLEGHRCFECGKEKEAGTSDLCGECLEEK